jgi:hypothetical protein
MTDHISKYSQALEQWYDSPLGSTFKAIEDDYVDKFLSKLFGYHLVQVGGPNAHAVSDASPIAHRIQIAMQPCDAFPGDTVRADPQSLPLRPNSVDVVLLPHVLECLAAPDDCLADVAEALVLGGHVVIVGFNPISLLRFSHALSFRTVLPSTVHWHSRAHMQHCLHALGLTIKVDVSYFFRPAFRRRSWLQACTMLDTLGQFLWPHSGGGYVMVAQKSAHRPLRVTSGFKRRRRALVLGAAVEPSGFDAGTQ